MDDTFLKRVEQSTLSDVRLAEELGVSRYAVRQARTMLRLPPRGQAGRPKLPQSRRIARSQLERAIRDLDAAPPEARMPLLESIVEAVRLYLGVGEAQEGSQEEGSATATVDATLESNNQEEVIRG